MAGETVGCNDSSGLHTGSRPPFNVGSRYSKGQRKWKPEVQRTRSTGHISLQI